MGEGVGSSVVLLRLTLIGLAKVGSEACPAKWCDEDRIEFHASRAVLSSHGGVLAVETGVTTEVEIAEVRWKSLLPCLRREVGSWMMLLPRRRQGVGRRKRPLCSVGRAKVLASLDASIQLRGPCAS